MKRNLLFLIVFFAFLATSSTYAQGKKISIQGVLKDSNGAAVSDDIYSVTFALYDSQTATTNEFTETANIEVIGGVYNHLLGSVDPSTNPLESNIFNTTLFLGIKINGGSELSPRTELTYSPYTLSAGGISDLAGSVKFDASSNILINATNMTVNAAGDIATDGNIATTGNLDVTGDISVGGTLALPGSIAVNVTGDVTGDVTGNLTGNVTGDLTGDIIGNTAIGGNLTVSGTDIFINNTNSGIKHRGDGYFSLDVDGDQTLVVKHYDYALSGTIVDNGRVGINIADPEVNLHVGSTGERNGTNPGRYFTDGVGSVIADGSNWGDVVAIFEGTAAFNGAVLAIDSPFTWSDKRIKKNIRQSNAVADLERLNQIEITDYELIDVQHSNNKTYKKVIAQDLKEIYPIAVTNTHQVIPSVYEGTNQVNYDNGYLSITTNKAHGFHVGDKVKVITPKKEYVELVVEMKDSHTFVIEATEKTEEVFVYGKYVDDFHAVDYDAIAMLNVSATQELYRMVLDLQQENAKLKANENNMESRLAKLEAMMNNSDSQENNTRASER